MKGKGLVYLFSHKAPLLVATLLSLTACGGSDSNDSSKITPTTSSINSAPVAGTNQFTIGAAQAANEAMTYGLAVTDADGDALTYEIASHPSRGTATISRDGTLSYQATNSYVGTDSVTVNVSDGKVTISVVVEIISQADPVFDYQFYKVANPNMPGSYQIVRYDPNDKNPKTNQKVIKQGVILGNNVFVMSGVKENDKTIYLKREYGVFLDQSAANETRKTNDEPPVEYAFYTNSVLKRFDARNTNSEQTIFQSSDLTAEMQAQGVQVISGKYRLYTTESDIDNSYVQLNAFDQLPDLLRSETEGEKKQLPIVVRISDSKAVAGRMISTVLDANGAITKVLINELGAYTNKTLKAVTKTLKVCNATLTSCNAISGTNGSFHYLVKNNATIYMAKEGDTNIYAFSAADDRVNIVSGVSYPAPYDATHHQIAFDGGHGSASIFSNLYNMTGVVNTLSEGDTSYLLVNYNLDTKDVAGKGAYSSYGYQLHVPKNALILKLSGTTGTKVYDNGNGIDLMNGSDNVPLSYNLSLAAVKSGYLFVEAAKFNGSETPTFHYQSGWLNTNITTAKTALDNAIVDKNIPYFTGIRVPPIAVGEHVYVNEDSYLEGGKISLANRIYNIYKMPINDPNASKASAQHVTGRMYFERSAYRSTGVYDGNVLLWDKHNKGTITNATTGEVMGIATAIDEKVNNVTADNNGNGTLSGIGGLFGLHMSASHEGGSVSILTSGNAGTANSLQKVNQINGTWIID